MRKVYDLAGMELTGEVEDRMRRFLGENSKEKRADHRYTWAATGLDREAWRTRTAKYVDFFGAHTESFD